MATYRLFPATAGPVATAAPGYSGSFISGIVFAVKGGGIWFQGFWWWVAATSQLTTATEFALWSATSSGAGVLVPGSVVTSGTLTANSWNYVPLGTPIQLAPSFDPVTSVNGSMYVAAAGCNGPFCDTNSQFNSGDVYAAGITNGPLVAYSGKTGSLPPPYSMPQGVYSTGGSDPSTTMPHQQDSGGDGGSNLWLDVQVSDTAPSGYTGSYRLWPNKSDANPQTSGDAALNYTIGTEVRLTSPCTLNNLWYYSQSGATSLATRCDVWSISTGLSVASITSPTWLTPSGGAASAGGGWVKAAFAANTTLGSGSYRVTIFNSSGTSGSWAPKDAASNYWGQGGSGGVGASGFTNGPLYAPSQPNAASGWVYASGSPGATPPYSSGTAIPAQPPFGQTPGGTEIYPTLYAPVGGGLDQSQNYWVDLEVTATPGEQGAAALSASATLTAAPADLGHATLTAASSVTATAVLSRRGSASLLSAPSLGAPVVVSRRASAPFSSAGSLAAAAGVRQQASAALSSAAVAGVTAHRGITAQTLASAFPVLSAAGARQAAGYFHGSGNAVLTCSPLSARIVMAANTMFPANQSGTYGMTEAETTVTVPGVTDGIYS